MRLVKKLLGYLNRPFDKDPHQFLALRLQYNGAMSWVISENILTTTIIGGTGVGLSIDLSSYTITSLVNYLAAQPGYSTPYAETGDYADVSAAVLLSGSNDISNSNGDHLYGYTNEIWAFYHAASKELKISKLAIVEMVKQMSTTTAVDEWLDEIGDYYGIKRLTDSTTSTGKETNEQYGPRIIAEVIRPRSNNVALEMAITEFTGQDTKVTDVVEYGAATPMHNGAINHDGSHYHNASPAIIYGKFDVDYSYDLLSGSDVTAFATTLTGIINRLRAAGTHLRALSLKSSNIGDTYPAEPTDGSSIMPLVVGYPATDSGPAAASDDIAGMLTMGVMDDDGGAVNSESSDLEIIYGYHHDGTRFHDGAIRHCGGLTGSGSIEGTDEVFH